MFNLSEGEWGLPDPSKPEIFSKFGSGSGYKKKIKKDSICDFYAIFCDFYVLGLRPSLIPMPNCPPPFFQSKIFFKTFSLRKRKFKLEVKIEWSQ